MPCSSPSRSHPYARCPAAGAGLKDPTAATDLVLPASLLLHRKPHQLDGDDAPQAGLLLSSLFGSRMRTCSALTCGRVPATTAVLSGRLGSRPWSSSCAVTASRRTGSSLLPRHSVHTHATELPTTPAPPSSSPPAPSVPATPTTAPPARPRRCWPPPGRAAAAGQRGCGARLASVHDQRRRRPTRPSRLPSCSCHSEERYEISSLFLRAICSLLPLAIT